MSQFADRTRIDILTSQKEKLSLEKRETEVELSEITHAIRSRGRMPTDTYRHYCQKQNLLKGRVLIIEKEMATIKEELRSLASQDQEAWKDARESLAKSLKDNVTGQTTPRVIQDLCQLRSVYREFGADHTRVSSMRLMASQFAEELDRIIKSHVNQPQQQ